MLNENTGYMWLNSLEWIRPSNLMLQNDTTILNQLENDEEEKNVI